MVDIAACAEPSRIEPASIALSLYRTVGGIAFERGEGVHGHLLRNLNICHSRLFRLALGKQDDTDAFDAAAEWVCRVCRRLAEERQDPTNFGDALPGWTDYEGRPITPARFSFADLIGYGPNPESGGVRAFVERVRAGNYQQVTVAAAFLTVDEAMRFASSNPAYAFFLHNEAVTLLQDAETHALREKLSVKTVDAEFNQKQRARAKLRYEKDADGKQKAKAGVKNWWLAWRGNPTLYASSAAFARAMLDKYPDHLTSQPVIEGWVRQWRRGDA